MGSLAEWLQRQPRGALTTLWRESGVSWHTINRAKKGAKLGLETAMQISQATGGEVPVSALTRPKTHALLPKDDAA